MQEPQTPQKTKQRRRREVSPTATVRPFKDECDRSGLSYKSGRAAVLRGEIAIIKVGRNWYVRPREIERYLEANTVRYGNQ